MAFKRKEIIRILLVIFILTLFFARDLIPAADALTLNHEHERSKVSIFSDAVDPLCSLLADNLFRVVKRFYINTERVEVDSLVDLRSRLSQDSFISAYVFRGREDCLKIGFSKVPWADFASILNDQEYFGQFGPSAHIVAPGNGDLLKRHLDDYEGFYVEMSPVLDIKLSYFYYLWTIADILGRTNVFRTSDMQVAGENLHKFGVVYFSQDFNDLVARVIEPVEKFGELPAIVVDEAALMKNVTITQTFPTPSTPSAEKPILSMGIPTKSQPEAVLSTAEIMQSRAFAAGSSSSSKDSALGQNSSYVSFIKMPLKSGIGGPVGKVVDALIKGFKWVLDELGLPSWIGISKSFLGEVQKYLKEFTTWLNSTVVKWFKDNLPYIITGGVVTAYGLIIAAAASDSARAKLADLMKWIALKCTDSVNDLLKKLNQWIVGLLPLKYDIKNLPIGFGDFNLFTFTGGVSLSPGFAIDKKAYTEFMNNTLFGENDITWDSILSIIKIVPTFTIQLSIKSFGTEKSGVVKKLFEILGLTLSFTGGTKFVMELLSTKANFGSVDYFKIKEWSFKFAVQLTKRFTIFDFFTGGAGGPVLAKALEYIGLAHFYIDVFFKITVEIIMTAATETKEAVSNFILEITLGMTADLKILIVAIKGGLEVSWKFIQDLAADTPLEIFLILRLWFSAVIDLYFLSFDVGTWKDSWQWQVAGGGTSDSNYAANALGLDTDGDGLSDDFEAEVGLNKNVADTDDDGLNDRFELDISGTKPDLWDSDGDGLSDGVEVNVYLTDPLRSDTDWDGINDYDEVLRYHTSPLLLDTDKDRLSDYYEISTTYNFTGTRVMPTVPYVVINGTQDANHTDPLNPDTDGDGLVDGEEGFRRGAYFGADPNGSDSSAFNFGYTHPLDYDTDDDSYEQFADGTVTDRELFYLDMNDGIEVKGQLFVFINTTTGEPYSKTVHTNPCNPDTDNDTASAAIFSNSDGYELSLTPPTDPTNDDMDSDGLTDGEEGTNEQWGTYHTDPSNPDTDNDGLIDGLEVKMGLNPLNPDCDGDQVPDGDEVFKYFTDPLWNDTDGDTLQDGEELFQFYSDPLVSDSDNDTIIDGDEAHLYGTDPVTPDTDGDGILDNVETFVLHTNPLDKDSDNDGIEDWDEINVYHTNPLNWDTDGDSITVPNENGQMTLPCGDQEEIFNYRTNPLLADTDLDGLTDSQELYLARGSPSFSAIPLDPLNNDTDADGLRDGLELQIATTPTLFYPYSVQVIQYPYGCSPVKNDTDSDGLLDGLEVLTYHSDPSMNDTDGDTLTDFDEVHVYGTHPANNDTDGDDLADNVEVLGLPPLPAGTRTNATNSDSDGDLLPDGAELLHHTNPLKADTDDDGIKDGAEFDYDNDGLNDGDEFYSYNTSLAVTITPTAHSGINITYLTGYPAFLIVGGFDNPDSDLDGLTDGDEVHFYHTSPTDPDTDHDGTPDGQEVEHITPLGVGEIHVYAFNKSSQEYVNASFKITWPDQSTSTIWTEGDRGYHNASAPTGNYAVTCSYTGVDASNSPQTFNLAAGASKLIIFEFGAAQPPPQPPDIIAQVAMILLFAAGLGLGIAVPFLAPRIRSRFRKTTSSTESAPTQPVTDSGGKSK